jgi:hypothetical protein
VLIFGEWITEHNQKPRAVVGSVSALPSRSDKADAALVGSRSHVEAQLDDASAAIADAADRVNDLQGGAEYKRH